MEKLFKTGEFEQVQTYFYGDPLLRNQKHAVSQDFFSRTSVLDQVTTRVGFKNVKAVVTKATEISESFKYYLPQFFEKWEACMKRCSNRVNRGAYFYDSTSPKRN